MSLDPTGLMLAEPSAIVDVSVTNFVFGQGRVLPLKGRERRILVTLVGFASL